MQEDRPAGKVVIELLAGEIWPEGGECMPPTHVLAPSLIFMQTEFINIYNKL